MVQIVLPGRSVAKNDCWIIAAHADAHFLSISALVSFLNPCMVIERPSCRASMLTGTVSSASLNSISKLSVVYSATMEHFCDFHTKQLRNAHVVHTSNRTCSSVPLLTIYIKSSATSLDGSYKPSPSAAAAFSIPLRNYPAR